MSKFTTCDKCKEDYFYTEDHECNTELKPCLVFECSKKQKSNDLFCSMHRARFSRTGRLDKKTAYERMMERTKVNGDCVEFTGYITEWGYGRLRVNGKKMLAHRFSWTYHNGEIAEGLLVCHKCDNPRCINIDHLFLGTPKDNVQDAMSKGRMKWQKN